IVDPPFAFGWMRLGTHLHATDALAGSARVWGVAGLSFLLAAFAGGIADLVRDRALQRSARASADVRRRKITIGVLALAPLCIGLVLARVTSAPAFEPGPRVMLVQPAFEQERKMQQKKSSELFRESCALTEQGLAQATRNGERLPD